jgi:hypothetical protein
MKTLVFTVTDRKKRKPLYEVEIKVKASSEDLKSPQFGMFVLGQRDKLLNELFKVTCVEKKARKRK